MHHYDKSILITNSLSTERDILGFTQEQLGQLLHLSADAIGKYERGANPPSLFTALGLELLFGKSIIDLYPRVAELHLERMLPTLSKFSIRAECNEEPSGKKMRAALSAIGDRFGNLTPGA